MLRFRGVASALLDTRGEIRTRARIAIIYRITFIDFENDRGRARNDDDEDCGDRRIFPRRKNPPNEVNNTRTHISLSTPPPPLSLSATRRLRSNQRRNLRAWEEVARSHTASVIIETSIHVHVCADNDYIDGSRVLIRSTLRRFRGG